MLVCWVLGSFTAVLGCSTGQTRPEDKNPEVLSGEWKGGLSIPQEYSSNRGMTDSTCDAAVVGENNLSLKITATATTAEVSGHLQCIFKGKLLYDRDIPATTFEIQGDQLLSAGKPVGKVTPVYFSAPVAGGKLTVVKFPTWEKVYFEGKSRSAEQLTLSGVFADRKTFADDENISDKARHPASD